jgi:hypothetical protein
VYNSSAGPGRQEFVIRINVDVHRSAADYLKQVPAADRQDFDRHLDLVRAAPIKHSEVHVDLGLSRFVLRRFEFGRTVLRIAIFHYDPGAGRIAVLRCRLKRPTQWLEARETGRPGGV